jgi:shikimate kinase
MRNPTYKKHIFLTGFSGSGKSTLGSRIARQLGAKYYDTDTLIERQCGKTIDHIFKDDGETVFRWLESQVIGELINCNGPRMVIALGAGAFEKRKNWNIVKRHGIVVYLSCSVREIYKRLKEKTDRPLLWVSPAKGETQRQAVLKRIKDLLDQRKSTYSQADVTISTTNKSINETVRQLHRRIQSYGAGH